MLPKPDSPLTRIRAILFDLDGTLVDTIPLILSSHRYATKVVLGAALPADVLMAGVGRPLIDQMRSFHTERADELVAAYQEYNARHHDEMIRRYPGVAEAVIELGRRGFLLGVVTSKARASALKGIESAGLAGAFGAVVALEDTTTHKPGPAPLLEAMARLGVAPNETAFVGDSPFDVMAGRAAHTATVAVTWGPFDAGTLAEAGADRVIDRPEALLGVFADSGLPARGAEVLEGGDVGA